MSPESACPQNPRSVQLINTASRQTHDPARSKLPRERVRSMIHRRHLSTTHPVCVAKISERCRSFSSSHSDLKMAMVYTPILDCAPQEVNSPIKGA